MTKACEGCGVGGVLHKIHHVLRRLPRVFLLHLKRFQVPGSTCMPWRCRLYHSGNLATPLLVQEQLSKSANSMTQAQTRLVICYDARGSFRSTWHCSVSCNSCGLWPTCAAWTVAGPLQRRISPAVYEGAHAGACRTHAAGQLTCRRRDTGTAGRRRSPGVTDRQCAAAHGAWEFANAHHVD